MKFNIKSFFAISASVTVICTIIFINSTKRETLFSINNDSYRAEIVQYNPRVPLIRKDSCFLKITDSRSGKTYQPIRDLLDGRGQGIKAEILGLRWISPQALHIERRVTEEGLRQDLIYGIRTRSFRDMPITRP